VLRSRLTEPQEARLVRRSGDGGYELSRLGQAAYGARQPFLTWSERWTEELLETGPPGLPAPPAQ
jgi:hypothetical protein